VPSCDWGKEQKYNFLKRNMYFLSYRTTSIRDSMPEREKSGRPRKETKALPTHRFTFSRSG
jgi:hypothetical protein